MKNKAEHYSISILAPNKCRSVSSFCDAFQQQMANELAGTNYSLSYEIYYRTDIGLLKEKLNHNRFDLLLSIDNECTQIARTLVIESKNKVPLVFSGIQNYHHPPTENEIQLSGVTTSLAKYAEHMSFILSFTPMIQRILILYDVQNSSMSIIKERLTAHLKQKGYQTTSLPVSTFEQTIEHQSLPVGAHDLLILLSQHTPEHYLEKLSEQCRHNKTLLYVSDTTSVVDGAGFGFGPKHSDMAMTAARISRQLLTTKKITQAAQVPYSLHINTDALREQGLALIKIAPLISLLQTTKIIAPSTHEKVAAYLRLEHIPLE